VTLFGEPREVTALGDLFANLWQVCWVTPDLERGMDALSAGRHRVLQRPGRLSSTI
jgi:hypothetical protein